MEDQLERVPVAELLTYASMDADGHEPRADCPRTKEKCYCAKSVVTGILRGVRAGWCPNCGSRSCRFDDLVAEYDRHGGFVRPIHVPERTVFNGHHRLSVAVLREAPDLLVSVAHYEDVREGTVLWTEIEAEWYKPEIVKLVRRLPYYARLSDAVQEIVEELGIVFDRNTPGTDVAMEVIRTTWRDR